MKILGIVCSPRKGGNTEILVRKALETAEKKGAEVEIWLFSGKEVKPCDHCDGCSETGICHIEDDMQGLYPKMLEADGIILGSPVYFWSVNAQAKLIMDRTYALRRPTNRLQGKVGGAVVVAERRGAMSALSLIIDFFVGQDMIPAGLGADGRGHKKGEVREDERGVSRAIEVGNRMADIIRASEYVSSKI